MSRDKSRLVPLGKKKDKKTKKEESKTNRVIRPIHPKT